MTGKQDECGSHVCPHKMAWIMDNWFRRLLQNPVKIVGEYIKEGDTVIDFGCGPGFFSIPMARMVGETGQVIAVDLQAEMLAHVKRKAAAKSLSNRVKFHQCESQRIGLELLEKADFMLAFYMVHETPDPAAFFKETKELLKAGGTFLVVEPKMHVKKKTFEQLVEMAEAAGFTVAGFPKKGLSVLLTLKD
jgi:FkbM family methyltransferase